MFRLLNDPCPICDAEPGRPCITPRGEVKTLTHRLADTPHRQLTKPARRLPMIEVYLRPDEPRLPTPVAAFLWAKDAWEYCANRLEPFLIVTRDHDCFDIDFNGEEAFKAWCAERGVTWE